MIELMSSEERVIADLAKQDAEDSEEGLSKTMSAHAAIEAWRSAAGIAGDDKVVEAIDHVGLDHAAAIYYQARRELGK